MARSCDYDNEQSGFE